MLVPMARDQNNCVTYARVSLSSIKKAISMNTHFVDNDCAITKERQLPSTFSYLACSHAATFIITMQGGLLGHKDFTRIFV